MLFQPTTLDPKEEEVLKRIETLKKELDFSLAPGRWFGTLRRDTFARAVRGSNSIEGYHVTLDDAIAAIEGEEPLEPKTEAWLAVTGYREAMTLVLQKEDDPYFRHSYEFLNSLHFMMLSYDLPKHPGRWRSSPIFVHDEARGERVYEGPNAELLPQLMEELIESLNEPGGIHPLVVAAMAHLNLVMIHPYSDGNGRMARCLQTLVLARAMGRNPIFVSIEEYLGRNTREYYDVLAEVGGGSWNPEQDTRPWIRFCLKAHFQQATTVRRRGEWLGRIFDLIEQEIQGRGLNERMVVALAEAAMGRTIRNATYRKAVDVSEGAAGRDLKELVAAGLLVPHGEKRGRYYTASPAIEAIAQEVGKPERAGDPFAGPDHRQRTLPGMQATTRP